MQRGAGRLIQGGAGGAIYIRRRRVTAADMTPFVFLSGAVSASGLHQSMADEMIGLIQCGHFLCGESEGMGLDGRSCDSRDRHMIYVLDRSYLCIFLLYLPIFLQYLLRYSSHIFLYSSHFFLYSSHIPPISYYIPLISYRIFPYSSPIISASSLGAQGRSPAQWTKTFPKIACPQEHGSAACEATSCIFNVQ